MSYFACFPQQHLLYNLDLWNAREHLHKTNNLKGKHTIENAVIMRYESCSQTVRPSSPSCSSGLVSWRWAECKELEFQAICLSQELFHLFCWNREIVMGFWGSSSKLQAFFCAYQTNSSLCLCATARRDGFKLQSCLLCLSENSSICLVQQQEWG